MQVPTGISEWLNFQFLKNITSRQKYKSDICSGQTMRPDAHKTHIKSVYISTVCVITTFIFFFNMIKETRLKKMYEAI